MRLDGWTIALQTVNFAILVWLLHRFLYQPVLRVIEARKTEIERQYGDVKVAEEKAKAVLADAESQRAAIAAEREAALKAAAADAQQAAEARLARAEREAQALIDGARKTLAAERGRALDEARRAALDLGAAFAQRLLAELPAEARAEAWIDRIGRYLDELPDAERAALVHQLGDGGALTVMTASPLSPAASELWRGRIRRALGDGFALRFDCDPALVAGAELHFPTAILRFSWQDALAALRSGVSEHANTH
jgi:F-type H+-transporting ATPase subunit b